MERLAIPAQFFCLFVSKYVCACVCVCKSHLCARVLPKHWLEWQYDQWEGKCPVSMFCSVCVCVCVTVAVSGDLIIWWTQQWRGCIHTSLSRAARLIRPLLMQSSGGTYRKYWSYFDRVFSPLHNQQRTAATAPIQRTQRTRQHHSMPLQKGFHLSAIQSRQPVLAC